MTCQITDWPLNNWGYGQKTIKGKKVHAHRDAYERANGPIPDGMVVRHTCDNPACINPAHLLIGTQKDNVRDCIERGRRFDNSGSNHPRTHLTPDDVKAIRYACKQKIPQRVIGSWFGIQQQAVSKINAGQRHAVKEVPPGAA
jgi:hypothetical protein